MRISRTTNACLLLAGALVVGCGDDDGNDDGTVIIDMDASTLDAGSDATTIDAARDAGHPSVDAGPNVLCSFTRSAVTSVANGTVSADDPIALSVRNDGASLSWIDYDLGKRRLSTYWFGSDRVSLFSPLGDGGVITTQYEPGNVATSAGFLTVWSDDEATGTQDPIVDVRAQGWGADGRPTAPQSTKLTTNGAATDEGTPVLASGADGNVLLVWQNGGLSNGTALLLDATGAALGQPHTIPNFGPQSGQPVLAALNNRFVLAWADPVALRVHQIVLDATGSPVGNDVLVDVESNAAGTVDLATSAAGGAIVFDVLVAGSRPEVRFHAFDASGVLTGSERVITDYPGTGSSPSIVPLAAGYVVAYRSPKAPDMQLQLALVDSLGAVTGGISVAPIVDKALPVALRIAPDGKQMFLSWMDRVSGTAAYNLQRTWVTCD
ncbi:MAG TPA: hypothetical protein VFX59_18415 [Polyangiales bacterium]|nr:hypothetical protein [Polyangiales bacterium]